jgi:hypothetical protein
MRRDDRDGAWYGAQDDSWSDSWDNTRRDGWISDEWVRQWAERFDDIVSGRAAPTPGDYPIFEEIHLFGRFTDHHGLEPDPAFRNRLRARLVGRDTVFTTPTSPPAPTRKRFWNAPAPRRVAFAAGMAALLTLVMVAALLPMVVQAAPDSPLFQVRRFELSVQLRLPLDPTTRTEALLSQAEDSLKLLEVSITSRDTHAYRANLTAFTADYTAARDAMDDVSPGSQRDEIQSRLATLRTHGTADLRQALPGMTWADRVQTTIALAKLGNNVPVVGKVTYARGNNLAGTGATGAGNNSAGLILHIHGSGFVTGAVVYVNGQRQGIVSRVTRNDIQVTLTDVTSLAPGSAIGVEDPDGTAAEYTLTDGADVSQQGSAAGATHGGGANSPHG